MGVKALVYFEVVTTAALFIGLAVVNLTKPGQESRLWRRRLKRSRRLAKLIRRL